MSHVPVWATVGVVRLHPHCSKTFVTATASNPWQDLPLTRSAGFARALPIVAAILAAATLSASPSRVSAPFDAVCNLQVHGHKYSYVSLNEFERRRTCP